MPILYWSVKGDTLSEFSWCLHLSGYSEEFDDDVIVIGVRGYEAQCSASDAGKTHLCTETDTGTEQAGDRERKLLGPTSW